jgi:5-methylcytosine-specific restriction endonuclease McrA
MMNKELKEWITILEGMRNDNTYKVAWGKAIIECIVLDMFKWENEKAVINEADLAENMIKYYWNQSFFFKLSQGHSPVIVQEVNKLIDDYISYTKLPYPVWYNNAERIIKRDLKKYYRSLGRIITIINQNPAIRFLNVHRNKVPVYTLKKEHKTIIMKKSQINMIKEYHAVLFKLFNYKWAQLLEKYNTAPNIIKKISHSSNTQVKRSNLKKYRDILLKYHNNQPIDFYTNEPININDISIDHVIPWSYIYQDDLWNLVITSKSNNSSKSNKPPTKEDIEHLKKRNTQLFQEYQTKKSKMIKDLELSINNKFLDKFYIDLISSL